MHLIGALMSTTEFKWFEPKMKGRRRMLKPFVPGSRRLGCFKLRRRLQLFVYLHCACLLLAFEAQKLDSLQT